MTTVLIVCAAGASGTFLARRVRTLAAQQGVPLSFAVTSLSELPGLVGNAAAVLIAPQLIDSVAAIQRTAGRRPSGLLPPTVFGPDGAAAALALAVALVAEARRAYSGDPVPEHS